MRFSARAFNSFLNGVGQDFSWRKAFACPCVNPNSMQASPTCPVCNGKGRSWESAVTGRAGVAGRESMKQWAQFGLWDAGDVMLSLPSDSPLYDMGQFDRVLMLNRTEPFSINMIRGMNDIIRFPVVSVDRVFWIVGGAIVEGALPTVLPNGVLDWGASAPPMATNYSLTGRRVPEYFVYQDLPMDRPHHAGMRLPRKVVIRRFDLYGR